MAHRRYHFILFTLLLSLSAGCFRESSNSRADEKLRQKERCERYSKVGQAWVLDHYALASALILNAESVFSPSHATCVARVTGVSSGAAKDSHVWFIDVLEHKEIRDFGEFVDGGFLEMDKKADEYEKNLRK